MITSMRNLACLTGALSTLAVTAHPTGKPATSFNNGGQKTGGNSTYNNPVLPGWHSDPSCTSVPEWNNTVFCTTSSFVTFPGVPIFASKDLVNYKHVSNALHSTQQLPDFNNAPLGANSGMFASTLRYHKGTFYLITFDVLAGGVGGMLFETNNPYEPSSWTGPKMVNLTGTNIDPDLFWDTDGSAHTAFTTDRFAVEKFILQSDIDVETGAVGSAGADSATKAWNGTTGLFPEGPHKYIKDGKYYLLIAEGGTGLGHRASIARSEDVVNGPWVSDPQNPILTAVNTTNYFQSVGHADLFEDSNGNWWAMALSRRSGPEYIHFPMSREASLVPCRWTSEGWPVCSQVEGNMTGPLPAYNKDIKAQGYWVGDPDCYTFPKNSGMPLNFIHYGLPKSGDYQ